MLIVDSNMCHNLKPYHYPASFGLCQPGKQCMYNFKTKSAPFENMAKVG